MSMETEQGDGIEPIELDNRPAVTSGVISLTAGILAMAATAPYSGLAILFGLVGLLSIGAGLFTKGSRRWLGFGVTSLFIAMLAVGILGQAPPSMLVVGAVGLLVSWDVGQHAITIGEQMGRNAPTQRGEVAHAAGSSIVGILAGGLTYGVYLFGAEGQPALAVILLMVGGIALVWALRD